MTEEERKEQTKKIYSLKMWDTEIVKVSDRQENISFTRVPGGWLINGGVCFIPIGKEKDLNTLDSPKVRI